MPDETTPPSEAAPLLSCLEGRPAPPFVIEGWKQLCLFSDGALKSFWIILAPILLNPGNSANQEFISMFCKENSVAPETFFTVVRCCELLLKQAAALDMESDQFRHDLEAFGGEADDLISFFHKHYPEAKKELRKKILMESLITHGKVMTDLEWRLDKVQHSSNGNRLNMDIIFLTLRYKEGQNQDHITLQLTPDAANKLKGFCYRLDHQDEQ